MKKKTEQQQPVYDSSLPVVVAFVPLVVDVADSLRVCMCVFALCVPFANANACLYLPCACNSRCSFSSSPSHHRPIVRLTD